VKRTVVVVQKIPLTKDKKHRGIKATLLQEHSNNVKRTVVVVQKIPLTKDKKHTGIKATLLQEHQDVQIM
jgi:hypothetical protein